MPAAKEQIRQIISENNLHSVSDVYILLKDSFKDILQELMKAELDAALGYEKNKKGDLNTDNKRNGQASACQFHFIILYIPPNNNFRLPDFFYKHQEDASCTNQRSHLISI